MFFVYKIFLSLIIIKNWSNTTNKALCMVGKHINLIWVSVVWLLRNSHTEWQNILLVKKRVKSLQRSSGKAASHGSQYSCTQHPTSVGGTTGFHREYTNLIFEKLPSKSIQKMYSKLTIQIITKLLIRGGSDAHKSNSTYNNLSGYYLLYAFHKYDQFVVTQIATAAIQTKTIQKVTVN